MTRSKYPIVLFIVTVLIQHQVYANNNASNKQPDTIENLQKNLDTLSSYYDQVNDKLKNKRDPFAYSDEMIRNQRSPRNQQQLSQQQRFNAGISAVPHKFTSDGMPIMKYRGYAESANGELVGLLEIIGMGVYTVKVGDQIGLHEIVKELVLTVEGLNRNNIVIETGKLGKKMVIQ